MSRSSAFQHLGRIDVHHHCFPKTLPELSSQFKQISESANGVASGLARMQFPQSLEDHFTYMDTMDIQTAVMAPSIQAKWHRDWTAAEWTALCYKALDAQLAYVSVNPLRVGAFVMVPLPHIEESIKFIKDAYERNLSPDGFALATAMGDTYLGDPLFDPVWELLNSYNATLFVHPSDTVMPPNLSWGPFVMEFPFDTCRCISTIVASGVLTRFSNIKWLFAHNGGAFPFLAGRIGKQHIDEVIKEKNGGKDLLQVLASTNICFDTSISSPFQWKLMQSLGVPTEHIMYATDYPYTVRQDTKTYEDGYNTPRDSNCFTSEELDVKICRENALSLFFPRLAKEYAKLR